MTNQTSKTIVISLSTVGVLFFISTGLRLLPWNVAVFAGIACFLVAGMVRRLRQE